MAVKFVTIASLWKVRKQGSKVILAGKHIDGANVLVIPNEGKKGNQPDFRVVVPVEYKETKEKPEIEKEWKL